MLSDPLVIAVMKRYGVTAEELRALLTHRARLHNRRAKRKRSHRTTAMPVTEGPLRLAPIILPRHPRPPLLLASNTASAS